MIVGLAKTAPNGTHGFLLGPSESRVVFPVCCLRTGIVVLIAQRLLRVANEASIVPTRIRKVESWRLIEVTLVWQSVELTQDHPNPHQRNRQKWGVVKALAAR